jgi:phosphoglycolate phosphatase
MMKTFQKPEAVLFDWDDTLADTFPVVHAAVNTTLVKMGSKPWDLTEARKRIGPPARVLFSGLFGENKWQEADALYIAAYKENIAGNLRPLPGAEETLRHLAERNIYMAVVSAKRGPLLRQEAAHLGFDKYFGALVGVGDAEKDKPDAATVRLALKPKGIAPGANVWFVGDGATDLICAHNAGCTPILIETKLPSEEVLAKHPPALRVAAHAALLDVLRQKPRVPAPNTGVF